MVHGAVHTLFRSVFMGAMLVLVVAALLAWRLSGGPVSMDVLAPYVSDALNSDDGSVSFEIEGAILSWSGLKSNPEIKATGIRATDQDGNVIAAFPEMSVGLSLSSLLEGAPSLRKVVLNQPVVRLSRLESGEVFVGIRPQARDAKRGATEVIGLEADSKSAKPLLNTVIRALATPGGTDNRAGYLEEVTVEDAMIVFADQISGSEWIVPAGRISLQREEGGVSVLSELPFRRGDLDSIVKGDGYFEPNTRILSGTIDFEDIQPAAFSKLAPQLAVLEGADFSVDGALSLALAINDKVSIDSARLSATGGPGRLFLPTPIEKTYEIKRFSLQASARDQLDTVFIDSFIAELQDNGPVLDIKLQAETLTEAPQASVEIAIDEITLDELKAYWPPGIKPNTNRWITQNLNGGRISDATFEIEFAGSQLTALAVSGLGGQAALSGIAVSYMRGMPPVLDTRGTASFSQDEVLIDVAGGRVEQEGSINNLDVQEARIRLHGLSRQADAADIDIRVAGNLQDAIFLIDHEPLGYATALGVRPASTAGKAEVLLSIDFPLIQDLSLSEVQISATASLRETSIAQAGLGLDLEAGQFSLTVDNAGLDVTGTAALGGIRTGLAWRENFGSGAFKRQYALDAVLENGQRELIGLGQPIFAPPYVDGPIRLEAIYTVSNDAENDLVIEADLRDAALRVPEVNWQKPAGIEAVFSSEIAISGNQLVAMRRFDLMSQAADLQLSGSLGFADDQSLDTVSIVGAQVGSNQFDLNARQAADGILDIAINGEILDGRTFWSSLRSSNRTRSFGDDDAVDEKMPFRFTGTLGRVLLSNAGELRDVDAAVVQTPTGLSQIRIDSRVTDTDRFVLSLTESDGIRRFEATSGNGGAVLKALGLGDDFIGGSFLVAGRVEESGAVNGALSIDSFKLVDAPLLARLLSVASLTGIVDELQGTGISFSKINLPFNYSNQVFAIEDGAMYGPSIGLTAKGKYDLANSTLDGSGTIVPAYAVNSALGAIPIVGPIFTGGEEGGGLFAATYTMRGNPDGGEITVNPLATLTPGFLREIFKVFDPPPAVPVAPVEPAEPPPTD